MRQTMTKANQTLPMNRHALEQKIQGNYPNFSADKAIAAALRHNVITALEHAYLTGKVDPWGKAM